MTRKKVKLAFISNDSSRKATFKKRKKGLMKKVSELSTLCGINACAIIYSPYDANPEVWPSKSGVQRVVSEFKTLPEMDQHKKMVDQETFLTQRVTKASDNLKRQRKDNRELEMTEVMFQCLVGNMGMFNMNIMDLNDLGYLIDQYLKDINRRIEILGNSDMEIGESSNACASAGSLQETGSMAIVASTTAPTTTIKEMGSSSSSANLFNPIHQYYQQQFCHPSSSHGGLSEQPRNMDLNLSLNHTQNQQKWFIEMMNKYEQLNHASEQMTFPFMDNNHHHYHPQHPQQQISGESSIFPAAGSSSDIISITNPNPTNNIWFG